MLKKFLSYVEIKTKITSLFAFLMALAWIFYRGQPIHWGRTAVFFASMFLFDLTTTAINNYVDTRTNDQELQFSRPVALAVIVVLFCVSMGLGLLLVWMTDVVVLLLGALCFLCGVFYTWGPLPISRMPLGEVFSGLFYGLLIPFLLFYMNMPQSTYLTLSFSLESVAMEVRILPVIQVLLLAVAPCCATANIMLANNICDVERDVAVKRYTLPYYLGNKWALRLFALLCYAPYAAAIVMVASGMLPWVYLLLFLTLIPVQKNINRFMAKQEKATTFLCSIQNYVVLMGADVVLLLLSRLA